MKFDGHKYVIEEALHVYVMYSHKPSHTYKLVHMCIQCVSYILVCSQHDATNFKIISAFGRAWNKFQCLLVCTNSLATNMTILTIHYNTSYFIIFLSISQTSSQFVPQHSIVRTDLESSCEAICCLVKLLGQIEYQS